MFCWRRRNVASISLSLSQLWQKLSSAVRDFNLFPSIPPSTDEHQLRNQRISTRIFIILLTLSLAALISYISLINVTQTIYINSPTLTQYSQLYATYPQTLSCACTNISINYDKFLHVNYKLHQICTSIFVTNYWISYFTNARGTATLNGDDFRASGSFIFQALNTFCQLSNQTISNRLIQFYSSQYVSAFVTPLQVFQSQTQAFVSQFISSTANNFILSLLTIRNTTQSNSLFSGQLTNYGLYRQSNNYVTSSSYSYGNCSCASSATCAYKFPIYDSKNSKVIFTVPGIYIGCYIIEALLQSNLQCFYNETCINKIQSYFTKYLSMNLTTLDSSLLIGFSMNSTIQELVDELMVEEWNSSTIYDVNYKLHQICTSIFVTNYWISYFTNARGTATLNGDDFRASGSFIFQALNTFCQLSNQTIANRLIQFYSSQYVTVSVTPLQVFQSQTQAFVSQFISLMTNDFLLSISTIRKTTQSNSLLSGQFTNYYLVRQSSNYVNSVFVLYNNCSCASSATCAYKFPIYDSKNSKVIFTVPGIYTGCYIIEALLQSNLQCFYNKTCINQVQSYFTKYLSMNLTTLDSSLLIGFSMNSTIQELVDELMVEEWNSSTIYDGYYNECQPSKCSYSYQTKNDAIYIITTLIGLVGGLITVLKLIVPRLIKMMRRKKEITRSETGKTTFRIKVDA
ncbi:unnamed protein product [Adineta steineri]|uniref:Transmembrane protein n=1 Tax=Adineta steineri TaxID=433720 RepID=A0A815JKM9_9BILA|nr:unnamed protein product [Adineta steineri]